MNANNPFAGGASSPFGAPMSGFAPNQLGSGAPVNARGIQAQQEVRKRAGFIAARIGARFDARGVLNEKLLAAADPDAPYLGLTMQVEDRSGFLRDAAGKPVGVVLVCMHENCAHKRWESFDAMIAAHPSVEQMIAHGEAHVWCYLSEEIRGRKDRAAFEKADEKGKLAMLGQALQDAPVGNIATGRGFIGLLSDEQWANR